MVLLVILHTSSTVKTSKNMVKSDISESICVGEPNFFWNEEEVLGALCKNNVCGQ